MSPDEPLPDQEFSVALVHSAVTALIAGTNYWVNEDIHTVASRLILVGWDIVSRLHDDQALREVRPHADAPTEYIGFLIHGDPYACPGVYVDQAVEPETFAARLSDQTQGVPDLCRPLSCRLQLEIEAIIAVTTYGSMFATGDAINRLIQLGRIVMGVQYGTPGWFEYQLPDSAAWHRLPRFK